MPWSELGVLFRRVLVGIAMDEPDDRQLTAVLAQPVVWDHAADGCWVNSPLLMSATLHAVRCIPILIVVCAWVH